MLSSVERLLFVRNVPIFKELRDDFLVRLASIMEEISFPSQHTIFTEGQEGRALYVVSSGRVSVHLREQELAKLSQGACFGEMSLFDAEPRSASVTTLEPCDCLILTQQQLYDAIDQTPSIAVNIIRLLSRRIRELNKELNERQQEVKDLMLQQEASYPSFAQRSPVAVPASGVSPPQGERSTRRRNFPYSSLSR